MIQIYDILQELGYDSWHIAISQNPMSSHIPKSKTLFNVTTSEDKTTLTETAFNHQGNGSLRDALKKKVLLLQK